MSKAKSNYWPHFILLSIFGVAGLCVWTVNIAVNNPVEIDSFYFDSYQNVELNYNDIVRKQTAFDKKYSVIVPKENFTMGQENQLVLKVQEIIGNRAVEDANVTIVVTRPDTHRFDKKPKLLSTQNGIYTFEPFIVNKPGRWQIMSKVTIGELTSFNKLEVNATN
jgi:hypothetical protein